MKRFTSIIVFICAFVFIASSASLASSKETFQQWLEKYGAWDRLENQYAKESDKNSPDVVLKRAQVFLNLNSPEKALEIVEMTPAFADNATEANRLWIGGQAHRAMGDLSRCVLWFTQAAKYMNNSSQMRDSFKAEPELEDVWQDVWLKMFWSYELNVTLSKEAQRDALNQVMAIGETVWGDSFWEKVNPIINVDNSNSTALPAAQPAIELGPDGMPLPPFITDGDMKAISRALASASLEKFDDAYTYLNPVSQIAVRTFWTSVIIFLETGQTPSNLEIYNQNNYLKAQAFWAGNLLAPYAQSRAQWLLGNPDSGPWTQFRNNLLSMPVEEANKAIDNELGSMLISNQTAALLNNFKLALSLSNGDFDTSITTWNNIDKRKLPISLQLAGLQLFKDDFNNVLPLKPADAFKLYPVLTALSSAAGHDSASQTQAPFWTSASPDRLKSLSQKDWPVDKLLRLAYWQQLFAKKPSMELAKRSAFLFDDSSFGLESMLYLADQAVQAKKLQLGAFYLNLIDASALPTPLKITWLDIKTRLELDSARQNAALKTYKEMVATGGRVPVMTRLRMALLFQQRRDFETAEKELLALWDSRATLTTALQAETLFWLGEGEQAMKNSDKALDYYLQLAWQYPQENIWALTAMYRASLIYEKRGKYDAAKRLLNTVVRRADRKEQREAAKARIAAIDKKMGKQKNNSKSKMLVYPF